MTITLKQIKSQLPCKRGWDTLTAAVGSDLDTVVSIGDIVLSNGMSDALWALRCLPPRELVAAVMPAVKRASAHTTDARVSHCIAEIDRWLAGDDTVDLRAAEAARAAGAEAAWAAARATEAEATWAVREATAEAAWAAPWVAGGAAAERDRQRADLLAMFPPTGIVK